MNVQFGNVNRAALIFVPIFTCFMFIYSEARSITDLEVEILFAG